MKIFLPDAKNSESGQAVLIILLIMTVILTIGLSVVSRSVTDVKISQQTQESARAFWVAQAGLEKAIKANAGITTETLNNINYSVSKIGLGAGKEFVFPEKAKASESVTLWLVGHNESTGEINDTVSFKDKITLYWGNEGESSDLETTPALEATLIYNKGGFKTMRYVFDPYSDRSVPTYFSTVNGPFTISGQNFSFSSDEIDLKDFGTPYFLLFKLLFNTSPQVLGAKVSSSSSSNLPSQGNCFESQATISESGIVRKLKQCQFWLVSPNIFDYVLFSGGGI